MLEDKSKVRINAIAATGTDMTFSRRCRLCNRSVEVLLAGVAPERGKDFGEQKSAANVRHGGTATQA